MTGISLLILNGPGLADQGTPDGEQEHSPSLDDIRRACAALGEELGLTLEFQQTDDEVEMLRWITSGSENCDALVINPMGRSRSDCEELARYHAAINTLAASGKPLIEVHLTNIFRQAGGVSTPLQATHGSAGFICGLGIHGYLLAIRALERRLTNSQQATGNG